MIARNVLIAFVLTAAPFSASAQTPPAAPTGCTLRAISDHIRTPQEKAATLVRCEAIAVNAALPTIERENALLALGFATMNDQPASGQRYFDRALALSPNNPIAHTMRGVTLIAQEKWNEAYSDFTRAIELNPRDMIAWQRRGSVQNQLGRKLEAMADYSRSIEIQPTSKALSQRGLLQVEARDYDAALADFSQAIQIDGNEGAHYVRRSYVYVLKGDIGRAEQDAVRAEQIMGGVPAVVSLKQVIARARTTAPSSAQPPAALQKK